MRKGVPILAILVGLAVLPARLGTVAVAQRIGGTIYTSPTEEPIRDGLTIIRDGKIAAVGGKASVAIPPNIQTIDCSG